MNQIPQKPKYHNADSYHAELVNTTENGTLANTAIVERILESWWNNDNRTADLALADLFDLYGDHERATDYRKHIVQMDQIKSGLGFSPTLADWKPEIYL